jgi:hypothetical protein
MSKLRSIINDVFHEATASFKNEYLAHARQKHKIDLEDLVLPSSEQDCPSGIEVVLYEQKTKVNNYSCFEAESNNGNKISFNVYTYND